VSENPAGRKEWNGCSNAVQHTPAHRLSQCDNTEIALYMFVMNVCDLITRGRGYMDDKWQSGCLDETSGADECCCHANDSHAAHNEKNEQTVVCSTALTLLL